MADSPTILNDVYVSERIKLLLHNKWNSEAETRREKTMTIHVLNKHSYSNSTTEKYLYADHESGENAGNSSSNQCVIGRNTTCIIAQVDCLTTVTALYLKMKQGHLVYET